ncbi:hypothetical protein [Streptomyces sp. NPDC002889]|uniref:hypothetical protein n=1 Tax=Streptomyces sp. NPDC002889 TaxID=3364669 RepID=UPI0036B7E546
MSQVLVTALMADGRHLEVTRITAFKEPWLSLEPDQNLTGDGLRMDLGERLRQYLMENGGRALVLHGPDEVMVCPPGSIPQFRVV